MRKHDYFIMSSIESVMSDGIMACALTERGMESYPLAEYVMQSLFLRMTGFNEQKLKCIMWELATEDYEIRYKLLNGRISIGECSSIADKNTVLGTLINSIKRHGNYDLDQEKKSIINGTYVRCKELFGCSVFKTWMPREFNMFLEILPRIEESKVLIIGKKSVLFKNDGETSGKYSLYRAFEDLYRHRNRCAHNLLSYQDNTQDFDGLSDGEHGYYENWFVRYYILALIDNLFTYLYDVYRKLNIYQL